METQTKTTIIENDDSTTFITSKWKGKKLISTRSITMQEPKNVIIDIEKINKYKGNNDKLIYKNIQKYTKIK
jgi:hypothetical protein